MEGVRAREHPTTCCGATRGPGSERRHSEVVVQIQRQGEEYGIRSKDTVPLLLFPEAFISRTLPGHLELEEKQQR